MKNHSIFNFFSSGNKKQEAPLVSIIPSKRKKRSLAKKTDGSVDPEKKSRVNKSTNKKKSKAAGKKRENSSTFEFLYDSLDKAGVKEESGETFQALCNQETNLTGPPESRPVQSNQMSHWMKSDQKENHEVQLTSLLSSNTLAQISNTLNKASVEKRFQSLLGSKLVSQRNSSERRQPPSMREKYANLVLEKEELALPQKGKRLLDSFGRIDSMLVSMNSRFLEDVLERVSQVAGEKTGLEELRQMLYLWEGAYKITYRRRGQHLKELVEITGLVLQAQQIDNKLAFRKNFMKKQLEKWLKTHHYRLFPEIEVDELTCWHPDFRVDSVPDVPMASLKRPAQVADYVSRRQSSEKQAGVEQKESVSKIELIKQQYMDKYQDLDVPIIPSTRHIPVDSTRLTHLIRMFYLRAGVSNVFYGKLLQHVHHNHPLMTIYETQTMLDSLIAKSNGWLTKNTGKYGAIVQMDKTSH